MTRALLDAGALAATFLGLFLLGTLYMSLGCFASSLTSNQIVAAMITFAIGLGLFILSFAADRLAVDKTWADGDAQLHLPAGAHGGLRAGGGGHPLPGLLLDFERLLFVPHPPRGAKPPLEITCRHPIPILPVSRRAAAG